MPPAVMIAQAAVYSRRMAGLGISLPFVPTFTSDELSALAREVEARGYRSAWMGESAGADAVTVMTLMAAHTRQLEVATAVLPIQTRTPIVLAMTASWSVWGILLSDKRPPVALVAPPFSRSLRKGGEFDFPAHQPPL